MTLSIKNGGYAFLIRLDLMFSMSLWKEFQLLQILNDLFIRRLIKLILYENDYINYINDYKETGQATIKSTYRRNNRAKFRKWITRVEFAYFRSTIYTGSYLF